MNEHQRVIFALKDMAEAALKEAAKLPPGDPRVEVLKSRAARCTAAVPLHSKGA